eukprot:355993-Chlamydomonas_euryale.AAC.15
MSSFLGLTAATTAGFTAPAAGLATAAVCLPVGAALTLCCVAMRAAAWDAAVVICAKQEAGQSRIRNRPNKRP